MAKQAKYTRWIEPAAPVEGSLLDTLLQAAGVTADERQSFLEPRLAALTDPFAIAHLQEAAERMVRFLQADGRLLIYCDYDVDGTTSAALMARLLAEAGWQVEVFAPMRMEEGYGLSRTALERALSQHQPGMVLALDCGTRSDDEVAWLNAQGIEVIIIDHHTREDALPAGVREGCVLVNPHLYDPPQAAYAHLCTAGLAFKLAHGVLKVLQWDDPSIANRIRLRDYLDLVAVGTVCDLVPLRAENRTLTLHGMRVLQRRQRAGLTALLTVSGMKTEEPVNPEAIGFRIGPRINAGGRIEDASMPIELLITDEHRRASELAAQLDQLNRERQQIERRMFLEAESRLQGELPAGVVLWDENWHPGVVGIVAGRVARAYHRPCLILGWDGDRYKGSGRSVEGVSLMEVLPHCDSWIEQWGGHPAAAGLTINPDHLHELASAFASAVDKVCPQGLSGPTLRLSAWIGEGEPVADVFGIVSQLEPFGMNNPLPVFGMRAVVLPAVEKFGQGHLRFKLPQGNIPVIAWNGAEDAPPVREPIDLALRPKRDFWNGREILRFELVDWRPAQ